MKTLKELLIENGFDDNIFAPSELDKAFIGIAVTDWHYDRLVYDLKLCPNDIPTVPEGMKSPLFVNLIPDIEKVDLNDFVVYSPEKLNEAICAITTDGQVVYEIDELADKMMEAEGWNSEEAEEWISFNTLRDYSYRDKGPVVYMKLDYIFEE